MLWCWCWLLVVDGVGDKTGRIEGREGSVCMHSFNFTNVPAEISV